MQHYLKNNKLWAFGIIIYLGFFILKRNSIEKKKYSMLLVGFITSLIFVFIFPLIKISLFLGINSYRYLFFFEVLTAVFIGAIIDLKNRVIELKKQYNNYKKNRKIESTHQYYFTISKSIIILLLIFLSFGSLLFPNLPSHNFQKTILSRYENEYGDVETIKFDYTKLNPDLQNIINWIKENTDNQSRILFQDSGEESDHVIGGGHNLCLVALYTNKMYANGYLSHHWYKYSNNSTFIDDMFLGLPVENASDEEIFKRLDVFNIEYIIVWSIAAKFRFNLLENNTGMIAHINSIGIFTIFKFLNASRNYMNVPYSNLIWRPSSISLTIENLQNQSILIFKMHDFPNWKVYINGTKMKKINDPYINPDNLIMIEIPSAYVNSTSLSFQIIWEVSFIENGSLLMSLCSLFGVMVYAYKDKINQFLINLKKRREK